MPTAAPFIPAELRPAVAERVKKGCGVQAMEQRAAVTQKDILTSAGRQNWGHHGKGSQTEEDK